MKNSLKGPEILLYSQLSVKSVHDPLVFMSKNKLLFVDTAGTKKITFYSLSYKTHMTHGIQRGSFLSFNPLIFKTVNWHLLPCDFVNIWKNFCKFKFPLIWIKLTGERLNKFHEINFCVNYHNDTAILFNRVKQWKITVFMESNQYNILCTGPSDCESIVNNLKNMAFNTKQGCWK